MYSSRSGKPFPWGPVLTVVFFFDTTGVQSNHSIDTMALRRAQQHSPAMGLRTQHFCNVQIVCSQCADSVQPLDGVHGSGTKTIWGRIWCPDSLFFPELPLPVTSVGPNLVKMLRSPFFTWEDSPDALDSFSPFFFPWEGSGSSGRYGHVCFLLFF